MATTTTAYGKTVKQQEVVIPDLTVKDLLSVIPAHCFKRSAIRSGSYVVWDFFLLGCFYKGVKYADPLIDTLNLPNPHLYTAARFALWAGYTVAAGLVATGLWVIAHECGHQAFSESKTINNTVGWFLHSALGVPYHSWRITHAKHHASTGHMTEDQVFVPRTRSERGLPAFNPDQENLEGSAVSSQVMNELYEALGDSPIAAAWQGFTYLIVGWPMYLATNASGQMRYPSGTHHYNPDAKSIFRDNQYGQIVISDIGVLFWLAGMAAMIYYQGFFEFLRVYFIPYLWVNHWLVLITFLQHTDPLLPHYRAGAFTFPRGALATLDRSLLGDMGPIAAWIGATATHGISETHVLHHVSSKIPHYNAWEAADALRARLAQAGIDLQGRPGSWSEIVRVMRQCRFVEDQGDIVFYKNGFGLAAAKPAVPDVADSGVEVDKDSD